MLIRKITLQGESCLWCVCIWRV